MSSLMSRWSICHLDLRVPLVLDREMHFRESPVEILFPFVIFLPRLQYGGPSLLMVAPNSAALRLPAGGFRRACVSRFRASSSPSIFSLYLA